MDTLKFIADCLTQVQFRLSATCAGLTPEQVTWRPAASANNIGFILWHVSRNEDARIRDSGGPPDLWVTGEWYRQFGQPITSPDPGDRLGFRSLAIPSLDVLMAYSDAVHQRSLSFVASLSPARLEESTQSSSRGQTVAGALRHMITHKNNHHGQIDYIRGLQDDSWDLPPGTGSVLP